MRIPTDEPMLTPRLPVIAHLRPVKQAMEIRLRRSWLVMALCFLGLLFGSILAAWAFDTLAKDLRRRVVEAQARIDEDQRIAEMRDEKGDPL